MFICARPLDQKLGSSLIYLFLFVHNHSTKVRSHSYSILFCANILFAMFKAVLPLYFVCSVSDSSAFTYFQVTASTKYFINSSKNDLTIKAALLWLWRLSRVDFFILKNWIKNLLIWLYYFSLLLWICTAKIGISKV